MPAGGDVFLSYSSADALTAGRVVAALTAAGVSVWRDKTRIDGGQAYKEAIVRGMREARVVLVLCTPNSLASANVAAELDLAWDELTKPILQLWAADRAKCVVPDRFVLLLNRGRQYLTMHHRPDADWLPEVLAALAGQGVLPVVAGGRRPRERGRTKWLLPAVAGVLLLGVLAAVVAFVLPACFQKPAVVTMPAAATDPPTTARAEDPPLTVERVEAVRKGMTRDEVNAALGRRGQRATLPDLNAHVANPQMVERRWRIEIDENHVVVWGEYPDQVFVAFSTDPFDAGSGVAVRPGSAGRPGAASANPSGVERVVAVVAFLGMKTHTPLKFITR